MQVGRFLVDRPLFTVSPDDTLAHCAAMMREHGRGSATVVAPGEPPGIITERDLLRAVADGADMGATRVAEYRTANAVTVTPTWHVVDAARIMIERRFRHLVVVDPAGTVLGVLSIRDIARALLEERQGILAG
ncbi:MAG: CBS domain-containing protein [Actinobacteria bacterium]|nr:CBS domain-containing protein [Actinomycetota bacterium]